MTPLKADLVRPNGPQPDNSYVEAEKAIQQVGPIQPARASLQIE